MTHPDGSVYEGELKKDLKDGYGVEKSGNGGA